MEEQEITQTTVETPAPAEPDWKAEYEKVKPIVERAESLEKQYKGLQRQLDKARSENVSKADIAELEDRLAAALDALSQPDDDDEPKRKPRPSEIVRAARPKQEPKPDNPVFAYKLQVAEELIGTLGLSVSEQEKFAEQHPDIDDAIKELRKRNDTRIAKAAADEALQTFRQQQKATGATKGDGAPSAASMDWYDLRRKYNDNPNDPRIAKEWEAIRNSRPK